MYSCISVSGKSVYFCLLTNGVSVFLSTGRYLINKLFLDFAMRLGLCSITEHDHIQHKKSLNLFETNTI